MYRLLLLGGASLTAPSGPVSGRAGHRQRLALLTLLATAGENGCSRDKLVAYLWPENDTSHARHRLSDSLYILRQALGEDPVAVVGEHMWLNRELVWVDVLAFEEALERGDREAAARLYSGPFLDGFHLGDSQEFEDWLETERARLAELYSNALESLARRAAQAGDHAKAADWWKQLLATDPYNSRITLNLMEALAAAGDPANAIQQALAHERLLREQLDIEPSPEVRALIERLRAEPSVADDLGDKTGTGNGDNQPARSLEGLREPALPSSSTGLEAAQPQGRWNRFTLALAAIAVVATSTSVWLWWRTVTLDIVQPLVEFYLDPPDATSFSTRLVLSPDGRRLVAQVKTDNGSVLYQRMLEARDWEIIPGTEGAYAPFFSPDGKWLAFFSDQETSIKKVPVGGGSAHTITHVAAPVEGASWGADNIIVFSSRESASGDKRLRLFRVAADGGIPERLTTSDPALEKMGPRDPHHMASGDVVLFTDVNTQLQPSVAALSLATGRVSRLARGMNPLSDRAGRVLYVTREGSVVAHAFNPSTLALEGSPKPIVEGVAITVGFLAAYTVSSDGSLAYLSKPDQADQLMLVNRSGDARPLFATGLGSRLGGPRFSPSGDRIAFGRDDDVWVYSFAQGTAQRLSFDGPAADPAWTADGRFIAYSVAGEGDGSFASLYRRAADGTGSAEQILACDRDIYQVDFAPGDSEVVFYSASKVFRASLDSDSGPVPLIETESFVEHPTLSPDGRWLAYKSNESGCNEVYVRSYPDMGPPTVISNECGGAPAWSADGNEIFYWGPNRIVAASVRYDGSRVTVVERAELFSTEPFRWFYNRNYDVHPNGQEFVMVRRPKTRAVVRVNSLTRER